jgi:hypothetical protein
VQVRRIRRAGRGVAVERVEALKPAGHPFGVDAETMGA